MAISKVVTRSRSDRRFGAGVALVTKAAVAGDTRRQAGAGGGMESVGRRQSIGPDLVLRAPWLRGGNPCSLSVTSNGSSGHVGGGDQPEKAEARWVNSQQTGYLSEAGRRPAGRTGKTPERRWRLEAQALPQLYGCCHRSSTAGTAYELQAFKLGGELPKVGVEAITGNRYGDGNMCTQLVRADGNRRQLDPQRS